MGLLNFGRKKEDKGCGCKIEVEREIEGECTSLPTQEIKVKCSCESQCGISDIKNHALLYSVLVARKFKKHLRILKRQLLKWDLQMKC